MLVLRSVHSSKRGSATSLERVMGYFDRLWDVADMVALWESYERAAERHVA